MNQTRPLLSDKHNLVAVRTAEFLGTLKAEDPRPTLNRVLASTESPVEALIAMNAVVYLQDQPGGYAFDVSKMHFKVGRKPVVRRLEYLEGKTE